MLINIFEVALSEYRRVRAIHTVNCQNFIPRGANVDSWYSIYKIWTPFWESWIRPTLCTLSLLSYCCYVIMSVYITPNNRDFYVSFRVAVDRVDNSWRTSTCSVSSMPIGLPVEDNADNRLVDSAFLINNTNMSSYGSGCVKIWY